MLKGVSQKVIEVVHTDNRYFEKAILFLRPSSQQDDSGTINTRAREYVAGLDFDPSGRGDQKKRLPDALKTALSVLAGAAVACLFFLL